MGRNNLYRVDGSTGEVTIAADDFEAPNGLAFSPDESILYVSDTGSSRTRHMRAFDVNADGALSNSRIFAVCTAGVFDGFRCDDAGRIWTSAADGVHCYDPDGTLLGKVLVPEVVANVEWGGPKRNNLFICGTTSLYSIMLPVVGAKRF
ncbi:MAG: SMP-30/gluconolactonase/LRE family protein [Thermomicrobiales bacterium]